MADPRSRSKSLEERWLSEHEPEQQKSFLREFVPKNTVHRVDGIKYPLSNARAVEILLKCRSNNQYLKRIQGKASSEPISRVDDLMCFTPEGPYGPTFFNKKTAVRLLNLAMIYQMTARSRRSQAKVTRAPKPKTSEMSDSWTPWDSGDFFV